MSIFTKGIFKKSITIIEMSWFTKKPKVKTYEEQKREAEAKGLVESGYWQTGPQMGPMEFGDPVWVPEFVTPNVAKKREEHEAYKKKEQELRRIREAEWIAGAPQREIEQAKKLEIERRETRDKRVAECKAFIAEAEAEKANEEAVGGKRFITRKNKRSKRSKRKQSRKSKK